MERAPRPQFEGDSNKEVSSALEAGLKRRGIEPPAERTKPPQEERGDIKSRYDIAAERASKIKIHEEAGMKPESTPEPLQMEVSVPKEARTPAAQLERQPLSIKDRLDVLRRKTGETARRILLGTLLLTNPAAAETLEAATAKDAIQMKEAEKGTASRSTKWPGVVHRFWEKTDKGEVRHNPWFWLTPIQLVTKKEVTHTGEKTFAIPYEYSRQFETDPSAKNPLRPEDHEKVADYVDQQLKRRFVDTISGWGGDVDRHQYGGPEARPGKITGIKLTGFASPEGPVTKGPETLAPGKIDEENVRLAKKRTEAALGYTKADLEEVAKTTGVDIKVLEKTLQNVEAKEVQFSDAELKELAKLAAGYKGADDLEKIYNLVIAYNEKKIKDPKALDRLHDIVGSKRKVEIQVTYDGKNVERHSLPLPWLPLLLLVPLMRRRREEPGAPFTEIPPHIQEMRGIGRGEKPTTPQPVASEKEPNAKDLERTRLLEQIHKGVIDTRLPERGTKEFEEMEEATYTDDLYMFFDDPESIRLGIDYRAMADSLDQKWDIFKTSDERENYLANEILNSWKKKDRLCRQEAGVSEDQLDAGLDYENQPRQIQWTKMHARSLLRVVDKRKELSESERKQIDYLDLLSPQVKKMIQRRGSR